MRDKATRFLLPAGLFLLFAFSGALFNWMLLADILGLGRFLLAWILFFLISFVAHILLHEMGHLAAGLLSGYRFSAFRVFAWQMDRSTGHFRIKHFHMPGTAGQCLMAPPKPYRADYPYRLYNLGGGLVNLAAAGLYIAAYFLSPVHSPWAAVFGIGFVAAGLWTGLSNLIPLRVSGLGNDGWNLVHLGKNPDLRKDLWRLLDLNADIVEGGRYRDLPAELVPEEPGPDQDLADTYVCSGAIIRYNWLLDTERYEEALALARRIYGAGERLLMIYRMEILSEMIFLILVLGAGDDGESAAEAKRLFTPELERYLKATPLYPNHQRLRYAMARLAFHDEGAAQTALANFITACAKSPNAGAIENEKELIELADRAAGGPPRATAQECPAN
jgi:hypothetical protein